MKSVPEKQRVEALRRRIANELSDEAFNVFMRWKFEDINYIQFNRDSNRLDIPSELQALASYGLIEKYGTCCADVWYSLSDDGKTIQMAISGNEAE